MKALECLEDAMRRMQMQRMWKERMDSMSISRREFCKKYGFNDSMMCRFVNLQIAAGDEWIEKVEKALEQEGV